MSHRVLNHDEFSRMVNSDGSSRRLDDMSQGPGQGYYVSLPKKAGFERTIEGRPMTAVDAAAHRSRSMQQLKGTDWARQKELYQGGWASGGDVYLDVSERVGDINSALRKGYENEQHAVYNASRGADLHTRLHPELANGPQPLPTHHGQQPTGYQGYYRIQADKGSKHGWSYV